MRQSSIMILLVLCIPFFAFLNLTIGSVEIPLSEVFNILLGRESDSVVWSNIVLHTRLPQTLTAIACGAGLSVAGLEMQTVFHNPLAGPSVLGISSAASLGVAFVVLLNGTIGGGIMTQFGFFGNTALTLAAMMGAMGVMSIIVFLSQRVRNNVTLLIVGVLIGYIASAIIGVLKFFSSEEDIRAYVIWGLGSFARVTGGQVYVFVGLMAVVLPFTFLLVKPLNMLLLGERYAVNLGLNLRRA
ncbi:MAG: iron ABC transporter permease, partial [Bacteroidaceae bacterium]|nr:iron ABC transporter permease [Bacteroidaceae bacterium]